MCATRKGDAFFVAVFMWMDVADAFPGFPTAKVVNFYDIAKAF